MNILCALLFLLQKFQISSSPLVDRAIEFEDFRIHAKLEGYLLKKTVQLSKVRCAVSCLQTPACMSFNFYTNKMCELNSGDIFSLGSKLVPDKNSVYHGMKRIAYPKCLEKGHPKTIRDDSPPNLCGINLKRQDEYCDDNEESVDVDSDKEWQRVVSRNYQIATHGGMELGFKCEVLEVLEWYHFIRTEMTFDEAESACRNQQDADLFYRLNGTKTQLQFFYAKLDSPICFWLGVRRQEYDPERPPVYVDVKGRFVPSDKIIFGVKLPEPSNGPNEPVLMGHRYERVFDFIHDSNDDRPYLAVCDKISPTLLSVN